MNYVAIKVGVIGMIKVWVKEFGCKGIIVNVVVLGFIGMEMVLIIFEKVIDMFKQKILVFCLGEFLEIVVVYVFLVFDEAVFINGVVLNVDGGVIL